MANQGRIRALALMISDVVSISFVWAVVVFTYWIFGGKYSPSIYLDFWPVAVVFVVANALLGLYNGSWMYPGAPVPAVEEMRRLVVSSAISHFAIVSIYVLLFQTIVGYSRIVVAFSGVGTALLSQSFRNWMRLTLSRLKLGQIKVLLAGSGTVANQIAEILKDDTYSGFKIAGYFDGVKEEKRGLKISTIPYLGKLKDIVPEAKKRNIKILLACQDERFFRCQMKEFTSWFTYLEYLPTASAFPVFGAKAVAFDGIGGLEMVNQGRKKLLRFQKRVLDTIAALIAFAIVSPLFIIIPIIIRLTSPGPVFYSQKRVGRNGKQIKVRKFRSMYSDADDGLKFLLAQDPAAAKEWEENFKLKKDPRITPFGAFLRKTSLDELPQLFNVFMGQMSLIGPRPIVEEEIRHYGEYYSTVNSVRPGITGLWQVSGRSDTDYTRRVALDMYYVLNWSPWIDLWIIIRTFFVVILMRGAR